ncbi:MBL fold metallo-hydrolase [Jiangella gansuensis]|uniref:MBL fold metallo-hydrolase n=1 Tax=Jiangella gansuensis TaxID=281473 RepID=UPI0004B63B2F|nr:MBL fold metallo-hydrolase [Jiangella gansuensis]
MLRHLTGPVWLWPADPDPDNVQAAVGVVAGETGSIVVDAGHSPALARQVRAAMAVAGLPPAARVVLTHHHWDHTWGAAAWEAPVVAHRLCAELMAAESREPWSHAYLRARVAENPLLEPSFRARGRAVDDFADLSFVAPATTFDHRLTVAAGGAEVELEHVGGGHTPDSTVVRVSSAGVLFLGDCYYPPAYHLRRPGDGPDLELAASLVSDDVEWYVESHDVPRRRAEVLAALRG